MSTYAVIRQGAPVQTHVVQGSLAAGLADRARAAIAKLLASGSSVITGLDLAGSGSGQRFFLTVQAAASADVASGGLSDPEIVVIVGAESTALERAIAQAAAMLPSRALIDVQLAGSSDGHRMMAALVFGDEPPENTVQNVRSFGASGNGVTDDAAAIQAAIDAAESGGRGAVFFPPGRYLIGTTLFIGSNIDLYGSGVASEILAAPALDAIMLRSRASAAPFNENITISRLRINGNRASQTPGTEATGIKMFSVANLLLAELLLEEVEGHGIHRNNLGLAADGQRIQSVVVRGTGSGPTNTFGSCFAITAGTDLIFDACQAYDSEKAGYRLSGGGFVLNGCIAKRCGNGGVVPVAGDCDGLVVNGGYFSDNVPSADWPCDGIRLVQARRVQLNGVSCSGNYDSGIAVLNGCEDVTIVGGFCFNNGQAALPPGALQRRSGISVYDNGSGCSRIRISDVGCFDVQGVPTQEYGIEVSDNAADVEVDSCQFNGNALGGLSQTTNTNTVRVGAENVGLSVPASEVLGAAVTGTTATTDLFVANIAADELGRRGKLSLEAYGEYVGGAGTKTMSVRVGPASLTFAASAAGAVEAWQLNVTITAISAGSQRVSAVLTQGVTTEVIAQTALADTTVPWSVAVRGKLSDAADTIQMRVAELKRSM